MYMLYSNSNNKNVHNDVSKEYVKRRYIVAHIPLWYISDYSGRDLDRGHTRYSVWYSAGKVHRVVWYSNSIA